MVANGKKNRGPAIWFIAFILLLFFTGTGEAAGTVVWPEPPERVSPYKEWTVRFNQNIDMASAVRNISVKDSQSNNVTITTIPGADGKSLVVYAPQGGYTLGRTYTLCIDQNLTAANGNLLAKSISMRFVTDALAAGWVEEPAYGFGYIRGAVRPGRADTIKAFYGENNTPVDPEKIKLNLAAGTFTIQTTAVPIFTNVTVKAFKNGVEVLTAADVLKTL